jgi:hypothetical protein
MTNAERQRLYRERHPERARESRLESYKRRRQVILAIKKAERTALARICPSCGGQKVERAKRCVECYLANAKTSAAVRAYMRSYMAEYRKRTAAQRATVRARTQRLRELQRPISSPHAGLERCTASKTICMFAGQSHRHCECGLPITLDRYACTVCIAEQSRVERNQGRYREKEIA